MAPRCQSGTLFYEQTHLMACARTVRARACHEQLDTISEDLADTVLSGVGNSALSGSSTQPNSVDLGQSSG